MKHQLITYLLLLTCFCATGQQTERQYLSGTGLGNTVTWDFYCSAGQNSQKWSQIEVPSQWELQGFGEYTYGRWYKKKGVEPSKETGTYKYSFKVPKKWSGQQISIVFEGAMTDTEVFINGEKAGDMHQGGFYRFSYDITHKITTEKKNDLKVIVHKHSANNSINNAERKADWWTFGGIYRPVYLEAKPRTAMNHVALDAKADGSLQADIDLSEEIKSGKIIASIEPLTGKGKFASKTIPLTQNGKKQHISTKWDDVISWNPENPQLYKLHLKLIGQNNKTLHEWSSRIGFRTVEFRAKDGIYVNDTKIVMKGINRHSFYPEGGRTTNREISKSDALLLKEMNINAVRFHYPPDQHFLEMCDSIGLFVVDELAGWQNCYDTEVGSKLQKEMLTRDVNHPCIVLWSNGNEGGWNYDLDQHFADYDPQNRHVIHPWADFNGIDAHHYPAYLTGVARLTNGYKVFMPTEFMHGMYDQGLGAGLEDFWDNWTSHPLFAGAFMWSFADNAVKRTDKNGILDSDDFRAPDGIVGPYREKEGSVFTVREVWAPIQFKKLYITPSFNGKFTVSNKFLYTNLKDCKMTYQLYKINSPLKGSKKEILGKGIVSLPQIDPGETGFAKMELPADFFDATVLEIEAFDPAGHKICNWSWPVKYAGEYFKLQHAGKTADGDVKLTETDSITTLEANGVSVSFNQQNGQILQVKNKKGIVPFTNGPVAVGMKIQYKECYAKQNLHSAQFVAKYLGGIDSIVWTMDAKGLLNMNAVMLNRAGGGKGFDDAFTDNEINNFGLTFSYPEKIVKGMEWFGRGPYRVWKNRVKGTNYDLWQKDYNNTITGESEYGLTYPEFKGFHANLYWAAIQSDEAPFTVYSESDGVFLRMLTPEEPKGRMEGRHTMPVFPSGDISFLYDIPAIQSFKPISMQGPHSQPGNIRIKVGDEGIRMILDFDFKE
ncbi:glycoside hydrolase family 2 TIM barrel-domain containing protein [Labilibaculum manganireducens]|uniref:glycoside hydrolase family 2 protein n=1 Tax=Labilibaculum manganireducens TaxID=1940525 RepID=UPI0029F4D55E|nr:glycoside hydrolase family 2 TIM barrel-domain containing protein [Labilibaculum manganireducens]